MARRLFAFGTIKRLHPNIKRSHVQRSTMNNVIKKYHLFGTIQLISGSEIRKFLDEEIVKIILTEIKNDPFTLLQRLKMKLLWEKILYQIE